MNTVPTNQKKNGDNTYKFSGRIVSKRQKYDMSAEIRNIRRKIRRPLLGNGSVNTSAATKSSDRCKHTEEIMQVLLETLFSVRSMKRICKESQLGFKTDIPCGGGLNASTVTLLVVRGDEKGT